MNDQIETLAELLEACRGIVDDGFAAVARRGDPDDHQSLVYDLVHAHAGVEIARSFLDYAAHGDDEARLVALFGAGAARATIGAVLGRSLGIDGSTVLALADALDGFDEAALAGANVSGLHHLPADLELVRSTFAGLAADVVDPVAEAIHRTDADIPDDVLVHLSEAGAFGMSIDSRYGGFAEDDGNGMLAMVVATEELSRASLAAGGSLLTRPEILVRALEQGGTEEQKHEYLPRIAAGEALVAVAVTEPDHGSDVAGIRMTATRDGDEWVLNGVKTWCTFAGRAHLLMVLARTGPATGHKGLSLFVVEKDSVGGHQFRQLQPGGGVLEGAAIPTIGYRGMHSFEVSFHDWRVPREALVGGDDGVGRGFPLQMAGFENGRLQTAARAIGVMQRAYDEAAGYAGGRSVFGQPLSSYQLTTVRLGRMAATIQACRQFTYRVAREVGSADSATMSALIKAYSCRAAEWVSRDAMQIHGGYGYAEEYPVSRVFVDARVLSIFEGTDEVLALKIIGRHLLGDAGRNAG
jgi:(2S)-methylsuccinyl-CoA dehydrogenase